MNPCGPVKKRRSALGVKGRPGAWAKVSARVWVVVASALLFTAPSLADEDALRLALRGVKAYEEAHFALAAGFFERAVRDAKLKGQDEHAAMATANLVDVWLETGQADKAATALHTLGPAPQPQAALIAWKKAQVSMAQGRTVECGSWLDSAEALRPGEAVKARLELDRLRHRLASGDTVGLAASVIQGLRRASKATKPGFAALSGEIALSHQGYSEADARFGEALDGYREAKRFARVSALLWRQAACATAIGQRERALRLLRESLVLAAEMGLEPGDMEQTLTGFRAFAKRPHERDFDSREESNPPALEPHLLPAPR